MILLAPIDSFIDKLAANTGFQTFTGTANATAARARIYRDVLPDPTDGNEHTLAELQAFRPMAIVWQQESNGWSARRDGAGNCWRLSGAILVRFEWEIPFTLVTDGTRTVQQQSITDQQASTQFRELMSGIISNSTSGIMQTATDMNLSQIIETGYHRTPPEYLDTIGNTYMAEYLIRWGVA